MSPNPDDAPAGFFYQAGATAYLIDPAGAYSPAARARQRPTLPAQTAARARAPPPRSPRRALIFRSPGRPTLRRRLSTPRAPTFGRARARRRSIRPAHTAARARARPRWPRRARIFRSPGRPPLRRRLSTPRAPTVGRARARRRPIRPAGAAPPARARPRSRRRALTIPVTGATSSAAEIVDPAGAYSLAGASAATTDPAGRHSAAAPARRRSRPRSASTPVTGATSRRGKDCLPARHIPPSGRDRADRRPRRHVHQRL